MGIWDQFDDEEEDEAFRDAIEMAESVKDGWGAREQLEACLAVAEAALLSKAAKAQRREQAEEERRREGRERAMAEKREREEREARETVAAREREALRARREREAQQSAIPIAPAGPSAEELRRRERERQVAAEERAAKVRLANAQAAEIEAKAELMRAQARAALMAGGPSASRAATSRASGGASCRTGSAPAPQILERRRLSEPPRSERPTDRLAGGEPPRSRGETPLLRPHPATAPSATSAPAHASDDDPRPAVGLVPAVPRSTGADLVRFRTVRKLSQRELAALMGVGHGMVAKAELVPTKPVGEGMAAAFAKVALPGSATR